MKEHHIASYMPNFEDSDASVSHAKLSYSPLQATHIFAFMQSSLLLIVVISWSEEGLGWFSVGEASMQWLTAHVPEEKFSKCN